MCNACVNLQVEHKTRQSAVASKRSEAAAPVPLPDLARSAEMIAMAARPRERYMGRCFQQGHTDTQSQRRFPRLQAYAAPNSSIIIVVVVAIAGGDHFFHRTLRQLLDVLLYHVPV